MQNIFVRKKKAERDGGVTSRNVLKMTLTLTLMVIDNCRL